MPYGGKTYGAARASRARAYVRRGAASRAAAFTRRRNANKPVLRIQRKKYVPKIAKNTQSIYTLAKQVRNLQRSQLGCYQQRSESCTIDGSQWSNTAPLCFAANNFIDENPIISVANADTSNPSVNKLTAFMFHKMGGVNMPTKYDFWSESHDDSASREVYLPISSTMTFEFNYMTNILGTQHQGGNAYAVWPEDVTIHILKPKKVLYQTTEHAYTMPDCLPGFAHLADISMLNKNSINPNYWTVVKSKTIRFRMKKDFRTAVDETVQMFRKVNIHLPFPNKLVKPDLDFDPTTTPQGIHVFASNNFVKDIYWVVISRSSSFANVGSTLNPRLEVSMKRIIRWRDQHGVTGH